MSSSYAVLIDGGFLTKVFSKRNQAYPQAADVLFECQRISQNVRLAGFNLLRYYFYDAPPTQKVVANPLDGYRLDLGGTQIARDAQSLQDSLELTEDFALRKGETVFHGWKIGAAATRDMQKNPRNPQAKDFVPDH